MPLKSQAMLAKEWDFERSVTGWYCSEKLDGMRALWLPETRGETEVPFCTTSGRVRCTGLYSRYGKIIRAPEWWLDGLPTDIPLDGELYLGRGKLQETLSRCRSHNGDWRGVTYCVFDIPHVLVDPSSVVTFKETVPRLQDYRNEIVSPVDQRIVRDTRSVYGLAEEIVIAGGEGLMLREPMSVWCVKRSSMLLKVKLADTKIGRIVTINNGKGKHVGRMGSLTVEWNGKTFNVGTGFTDEQREEPWSERVGQMIEFNHKGYTQDGVPRELSFKGLL